MILWQVEDSLLQVVVIRLRVWVILLQVEIFLLQVVVFLVQAAGVFWIPLFQALGQTFFRLILTFIEIFGEILTLFGVFTWRIVADWEAIGSALWHR